MHQKNQDINVSRGMALQVLLNLFPDSVRNVKISDDVSVCNLGFMDCENHFYSNKQITQKEFLTWFYYLRGMHYCEDIQSFDSNIYNNIWLEARNQNWLIGSDITYNNLEEFIYRYKVSEMFSGHSYYNSLVYDISEINTYNFSDKYELSKLQSDIFEHMLDLKAQKQTAETREAIKKLESYYARFKELEDEIKELYHPFNLIPTLPGYIKENITKYELEQVIGKISYDYSNNDSNRKYNLVTGLSKVNGDIYMPGDIMDFMHELSDKNWWDYKWGWVIIAGKSEWQLGGGLCGSATVVFTPSWMSGLQIIKRYPHSLYYDELYPIESLGLDATIYRGSHKNLKIRNNTDDPIIYYVYDDKENEVVTLYIIGNSLYKNIEIEGPIKIDKTTYKWIRKMEDFDGKINIEELVTKYWGVY